jgi:propanol-preferring alcohol dehydrogenase
MRALRLESWKSEPVLTEVPTPVPGPGEVLVQVGAAGACHSDLHLMHDFEPGGLGHLAVQILRAMTAALIIAVDPKETARQLAKTSGADLLPAPGPDLVDEVRAATRGHGADVVLDFVGSDSSLAAAAAVTRPLGDLTIVGIAGGSLPVSFFGLAYEASVQTTYWGNRSELVELLDLAARGLLTPEISTFPLEKGPQVYAGLAAGDITGRAVVVPSAEYTP